ncbi:lysophospholipid acyltransferase family protein [Dyadobacter chenwenxiniae]|uniref:Lysophospholipid acyltransferase family protein n=1 Tax=Dyadobacter chenwenxiniae TaxID=2906456 RepID=A0A9X1TGE1_9BACT|nr:lysophospholipid acyltransferase family protein [Dyadobacter chenwenxiniae]MCF0063535.1 lysophospholipid acyltransferase family protein [Dyadobacter chenwenxiniae]UON83214.1 lysophospholipid acyltransferase family protein [Dyadobacter chenwenxiniae]
MKTLSTRLLLFFLTAISRLSWKNLYKLSDIFRFLIFDIGHYRKEVIFSNLRNSFPTYNDDTIACIARRYYRNFTDIIFETIKLRSVSKNDLLGRFELETELLDYYYAQQKNVVVVSGHLGNWEMLNLFASAKLSYQIVVVYHELANEIFEDWFKKVRTKFGTEMVPMKEAMVRAMAPREKPFLFVLVNDQSPSPDKAYWTNFLNQDTGIFRGGELIAKRLNAPVLYMGILRDEHKRGHYRSYFKLITENPKQEPTNMILQSQIEYLEEDIKRQPDNWLWSHRRWKHSRPQNLPPFQLRQDTKSE